MASAVVAGAVLAAPVTARAAGDAPVPVAIHQYQFHPDPLRVEVGESVTWTNEDAAAHDVTSSSGPAAFGSGSLGTGQSFTYEFTQPGSYAYLCTVHPDMVGSVTVTPAPTTTTAAPAAAASAVTTTTAIVAAAPVPASSAPRVAAAPTPVVSVVPGFAQAARPLALVLALAVAVVAGCLLLLGVGRRPGSDDR